MKKILTGILIVSLPSFVSAQNNIGIGTNTPSSSAALDITSTSKGLLIPRMSTAERTAIVSPAKGLMVFDNTSNTFWYHNGSAWTELTGGGGSAEWTTNGNNIYNNNTGNIGIGTTSPAYKMDIAGRIRLRHTSGSITAGLYLDGIINSNIGFMGTYDNNTIGMWGALSGWSLTLNTTTGYVGVGTTAPTADLDVNGTVRIRGNSPAASATLVSTDGNGNTNWQRAYAFKVEGLVDLADINLSTNEQSKVTFNNITSYNIGLMYNANTSEFTVPVKGIYSIQANLESYKTTASNMGNMKIELVRTRNGINTTIGYYYHGIFMPDVAAFQHSIVNIISGDYALEAQDKIWVRAFSSAATHKLLGTADRAVFSGHLITQLY